MKIKAILFDLDGTLIEPELEFFFNEANRLFAAMGFPQIEHKKMKQAYARGDFFSIFPHDQRAQLMEKFWEDYRHEEYPHPRAFSGALSAVKELHSRGIKMAIVTARSDSEEKLRRLLNPSGLLPYLHPILSLGPQSPYKPIKQGVIPLAKIA